MARTPSPPSTPVMSTPALPGPTLPGPFMPRVPTAASHQRRAHSAAAGSARPAGHDSARATRTSGSVNSDSRRANAFATAAGAGGGGGNAGPFRAAPKTTMACARSHPLGTNVSTAASRLAAASLAAGVSRFAAGRGRRERPWATRSLAREADPNERAPAATARDRVLAAAKAAGGTVEISPSPPLERAHVKSNPASAKRPRNASWKPAPRPSRQRQSSSPTRQLHLPSPARPRLARTTWAWR